MLLLYLALMPVLGLAQEGLYISNSTNILLVRSENDPPLSVYHDANARIVGIAIDIADSKIFWTDISLVTRGIYKADLGDGEITNPMRIIANDLGESNDITVDWWSKHIYWTDSTRRSIEVANYDGQNRRILTIDGLETPRGIVAHPAEGYLFWGDQGTKKIERSALDGSGRIQIVGNSDLTWPNHMVIHDGKLHYVDGSDKKLYSVSFNENSSPMRLATLSGFTNQNPVFGMARDASSDTLYISVWHQGRVLYYRGGSADNFITGLGNQPLFGMAYYHPDNQVAASTSQPCRNGALNGCSHLCLPTSETGSRCSCPSYGGLRMASDDKTCSEPDNALFYVLAGQGIVGFRDLSGNAKADDPDRYIVGRSLRPVAVAYDPVDKFAYWSDVHESTVHKTKLDGTRHNIFMSSSSHSIGVVDGLALDHVHRKLYYTNMGEVEVHNFVHRWHKIEFVDLDGNHRKTLVENVEKPRGLFLDLTNSYMYFTDWGTNAALVRTNLDGSNPVVLKLGLDNPNAVAVINSNVYVIDSHYKTRKDTNTIQPGGDMQGALYRTTSNGAAWTKIGEDLEVPFGLTVVNNELYISDWEGGLRKVSDPAGSASISDVDGTWSENEALPMGLSYSAITANEDTTQNCHGSLCEICVTESGGNECTCDTYSPETKAQNSDTCEEPTRFMLVADYNAVKLVDLDSEPFHLSSNKAEPQVVVEGNSYFSNFVAMAFDDSGKRVYYSDVNRGAIYTAVLGEEPELFYEPGYTIDGMDLDKDNNRLYWTGIKESGDGIIARMDQTGNNSTYREIITGLDRPRAIKLNTNSRHIYWTEWGTTSPRVARAKDDGSDLTTLSAVVSRPNGLDFSIQDTSLLIADASTPPTMIECQLNGENCMTLAVVGKGPEHIFSIEYTDNSARQIIFTDWIRRTVSLYDKGTGYIADVATDLMRPTEVILDYTYQDRDACPTNDECDSSATCVKFPGGHFCSCDQDKSLKADGKECYQSNAWIKVEEEVCSSCPQFRECSAPLGSNAYACHCMAGYYLDGSSCTKCGVNHFKPYPSDGTCDPCPDNSNTGGQMGSTECQCTNGNAWNWQTPSCTGASKPGTCEGLALPSHACGSSSCNDDADCTGAKKCCSNDGCSEMTCLDPVDLDGGQCIYDGVVYQVGQSFEPNSCVSCTCTLDKTFGNPVYGKAQCSIEDCPELSCEPSEYVIPSGACCPQCRDSGDCSLEIQNCPESQSIRLPADSFLAEFRHTVEYVDNCDTQRAVRVTGDEQSLLYSPDPKKISIRVEAENPNGQTDTAECEITITTVDETDPYVECPVSTTVQLPRDQEQIAITLPPPKITDNVCGQQKSVDNSDYAQCNVEVFDGATSIPLGTPIYRGTGSYTFRYEATDEGGNSNDCTVEYIVERNENLECTPPSVNFGQLNCDSGSPSVTCSLDCHPGYASTLLESVSSTCINGEWDPSFDSGITQKGCAEVVRHKVLTKLTVTELPCPRYSIDIIAAGLEDTIRNQYLAPGVRVNVEADGCENEDETNNFGFDIWLSADYSSQEDYDSKSRELSDLLASIEIAITSNEILDVYGDPIEVDPGNPSTKPPSSGCLSGQKDNGTDCVVCPEGTYGNDDKTDCILCEVNSYNDVRGRTYCQKCPGTDTTEGEGATSSDYCEPQPTSVTGKEDPSGDDFPIAIVAGVLAFVVVVVIVIIVAVCLCKKRSAADKYKEKDDKHTNEAYDDDIGETYDQIPANETNYESLNEAKREQKVEYEGMQVV